MARLLLVLALATISLGAAPASVQGSAPPAQEDRPTFLIESIVVENAKKFQAAIVVSESLLREGEAYTESELRAAVHRIVRLPLILDADFELEKGSERDTYQLVITVTEARRWFFGWEALNTFWAEEVSIDGLETTDLTVATLTVAGYRVPVGAHGVFFVTAGGSDGGFQLGYEQFNLFDRNVLLSFKFGQTDCDEVRQRNDPSQDVGEDGCATEIFGLGLDPSFSSWTILGDQSTFRLNMGFPIRGNHSIRLESSYRDVEFGLRRPAYDPARESAFFFDDREELSVGVSWVYNSLDDSIFPTRGRLLEGGLDYRSVESQLSSLDLRDDAPSIRVDHSSEELRAVVSGRAFWPKGDKTTLWAGVDGFAGVSDLENLPLPDRTLLSDELDTFGGSVSVGHAHFLLRVLNGTPKRSHRRPRWREVRWENELRLFYEGTSPSLGLPDNPQSGFRIGTGITFRNTWGVFSLRLSYLDAAGDR